MQMPLTLVYTQEDGFLKNAFEAIPHAVLIVDEEKRIHAVNSFLSRALGLTPDEAAGKKCGEVLGCVHARTEHGVPCNSGPCQSCQLKTIVSSIFETTDTLSRTVPLRLSFGGAVRDVALQVKARQLHWGDRSFAVLSLGDVDELAGLRRPEIKNLPEPSPNGHYLIGNHPSMLAVYQAIEEIAPTRLPVMIQGETGTGKELVARAIHQASQRAKGRFVPVNCAALPEGLLENELFGHVKGAFTGATEDRKGRFQLADGGSLLLDEIGDLSPSLQVKLLRVIQERRFERLGSSQTLHMDFRIISATNKDLAAEVKSGRFRADLFYRLCVAVVILPPLRERRSDIPLLVDYFLSRAAKETEKARPVVSAKAMSALMEHDWPGNVRELENIIRFAMIKCRQGIILPECFPFALGSAAARPAGKPRRQRKLDMEIVNEVLHKVSGNKVKAAQLLNVSRSTLYRFMDEMAIPAG